MQENESLRCSKWNLTAWMSSYKFLKGISAQVHHFLNLSPRSLRQPRMICSNEQTNIPCLRMTSTQLLSRSWLPVDLPKTTKPGAPRPWSNISRWVGGKAGNNSQTKPTSPPPPLNISYEKLLPMIRELSNFRWSEPIKTNPTKRDRSRKCAYHKEHGHTTKQCRNLHYLVEKLIRDGYLKQYVHLEEKRGEVARNPATTTSPTSATPRAIINYINGGPIDEEYNSKWKRQR